jgi:hypothetical protein
MIVAVMSLSSLIVTCHQNQQAIQKAVWMLEVSGDSTTYIPVHIHYPSSPNAPTPALPIVKDLVHLTLSTTAIGPTLHGANLFDSKRRKTT